MKSNIGLNTVWLSLYLRCLVSFLELLQISRLLDVDDTDVSTTLLKLMHYQCIVNVIYGRQDVMRQ